MKTRSWLAVLSIFFTSALTRQAAAQTPPPAPVLVAPAAGASLLQPITLQWQPVVDPDGPIVSYSWQVSPTSSFATVVAAGFNNFDGDVPLPTKASVSGLANGSYFWRVKAAQDQGAAGSVDSAWSAARTFTVTGPGPAPAGVPTVTAPAFGAQFHPVEFFDITWTEVAGAQYYLVEADDDPGFSQPTALGTTKAFGTTLNAGWGNEIPNLYYRVRAVSADNVRGLPSATLALHVTNTAPVPPAPTPLSPVGGATITLPSRFDWTDTANPQAAGYDIAIDTNPNFPGVGVLQILQISRSDYMVVPDPLVEGINRLPAGNYFWRVRAIHGNVAGPWSAGASFKVTALPATPTGLDLFWILSDPGSAQGGNPTAARIALNMPAPAGGMLVQLASDFPGIEIPASVLIPAGSTDAVVSPVSTPAVSGTTVSTIRAAFGLKWQQSSIGCSPILWNGALDAERVIGGTSVTGSVTLLGPAPPGGVEVTLTSGDTALVRPPASVFVPEGATDATFTVVTAPVTVPTRVVLGFGTAFENFAAPGTWLVLNPTGSAAPAPAVSTVTLSPASLVGATTGTGTVTLTAPAPTGGLLVKLSGSMEGAVVVPQQVTVPSGLTSVNFPVTPPRVARPHWVLIQASEPLGLLHASTLRVDPGTTGPNPLFAIGVQPSSAIAGTSLLGTVGLSVPAGSGGATVALVSSDPSVAQVPATVTVAAGNSTASFAITTSPIQTGASVSITGTAGGASKTAFINVAPDPNAPLTLTSISPSISAVTGGTPINTTLFLNKAAPAGGTVVPLSSSNPAAAQVPASVKVPAGLNFVTFNITTSSVAVNTAVTITGVFNATRTAAITVLAPQGGLASVTLSPASVVGGSPSTGTATLANPAPAGGTVVSLSSSNTAVATVPASVTVAAGATTRTFTVTTKAVASPASVTITGSAAGTSRTAVLSVTASGGGDTVPPTASVTSPAAGVTVSGTVTISAAASDNVGVLRVDFLVDGTLIGSDSSAPYSASWVTSTNGVHSLAARAVDAAGNQTTSAAVSVTVNNGSAPVLDLTLSGVPSSIPRGQFFTVKATAVNTGGSPASGYTVVVSFTPADSMRFESPKTATQTLGTVAPGGTQSVSWQMRADKAASATLTLKLVAPGGAIVDTATQVLTITN